MDTSVGILIKTEVKTEVEEDCDIQEEKSESQKEDLKENNVPPVLSKVQVKNELGSENDENSSSSEKPIAMELDEPEMVNIKTEDIEIETSKIETPNEPATETNDEEGNEEENSSSEEFEDDIPNYCKVCKNSFDTDEEYREHYKKLGTGGPQKAFGCCNCLKNFRDLTQLKVHQRKHTGEKPYACNICKKRFSINGNLTKHKITHTGERRFECDTCEKKFTQFAHLEDHMKIHSGERPFKCEECGAGFKTKTRLKKHVKLHDSDTIKRRRYLNCDVCGKRFSFFQLQAHMQMHNETTEIFPCEVCSEEFRTYTLLQEHMKIFHADLKNYICHICTKRFATMNHLTRHLKIHTGLKPFSCEMCGRAFPCSQNLKRHMQVHSGEKPYKCDFCDRCFLSFENMRRHTRTHTKEKPYSCTLCGKQFAHSTTAKDHMLTHTGEKPYGCGICNKQFALNKMLYRHIREKHPEHTEGKSDIKHLAIRKPIQNPELIVKSIAGVTIKQEPDIEVTQEEIKNSKKKAGRGIITWPHYDDLLNLCEDDETINIDDKVPLNISQGQKPYQCDHCDKAFKTKACLKKHLKSHDANEEINSKRKFANCEICNKRFTYSQIQAHMKKHKDVELHYKCKECGVQLKTINCLRAHTKSEHAKSKTHTCHICSKKYLTYHHLNRHLRTHAGIKPYVCELCTRAFPNLQNLKRHLQVHRGEKPYVCETCNRAFLTLENLKRHIRVHTKEKPYSCKICNKQFAHSTTLKEHTLTHTGEKPFGCGICNRFFTLNKMLYKHIRVRHPEHLKKVKDIKDLALNLPDKNPHFLDIKTEIKQEIQDEGEYVS